MQLRPGLTLRIAPLFADGGSWTQRLRINSGAEVSQHGIHPRTDWRPLNAPEVALLVAGTNAAGERNRRSHHFEACVLSIPRHLHELWWTVAGATERFDGHLDGFETFIVQLEEFLRFKRLPLPSRCRSSVVASRPGQRSTGVDAAGSGSGLGFSGGVAAANGTARLLCTINLGDEGTDVVLLNLSLDDVQAVVAAHRAEPDGRAPAAVLADFWSVLPTYPLVQLHLDPGEGLWLPAAGLVYDRQTRGKEEPDIVLNLWADPDQCAPPA